MKFDKNFLIHILSLSFILNIVGNTIKFSFKLKGRYIIWIVLFISLLINFLIDGINFNSFLISFLSFSISISNYDMLKYLKIIVNTR